MAIETNLKQPLNQSSKALYDFEFQRKIERTTTCWLSYELSFLPGGYVLWYSNNLAIFNISYTFPSSRKTITNENKSLKRIILPVSPPQVGNDFSNGLPACLRDRCQSVFPDRAEVRMRMCTFTDFERQEHAPLAVRPSRRSPASKRGCIKAMASKARSSS